MTESDAETHDERHQQLVEMYTEIASLAGGLAHEIKNPLSTMSLNLQLLAEDFANPETQRDRRALRKIEILQKECNRLEEILNDFLRFARVGELRLEQTDINELVRELIDFHAPQAERLGIVIRDDLRRSLPLVSVDRDLFKQALVNLIINAEQAMPKGGELILKTRSNGASVSIDVIDTGTGIAADTLEQIFDPFFSTKSGGNGLGLPTTRKIIVAHNGELSVESELGKGTAFTIQLPAVMEQD